MNLFTNAEHILLSKSAVDFRCACKDDIIENFTLRNLDTLHDHDNQTLNTKSNILAPFSSSIKDENLITRENLMHSDLLVENEVVNLGKVKEQVRQYELNNNEDIDNGILINPVGEEEKKPQSRILSPMVSLGEGPASPLELINNIEVGQNSHRNSRVTNKENNSSSSVANTLIIDENTVKVMEELGYKKDFLLKCLYSNDLNYATTAYQLLLSAKLE